MKRSRAQLSLKAADRQAIQGVVEKNKGQIGASLFFPVCESKVAVCQKLLLQSFAVTAL